ncbi:SGNH/GDSL hydrolase family protein [Pleurocapsa sp. PCC 7319]|uniref:SGNH/GDSL hydrolase family protein n=1 Tax=Pleurocapsa sp. PCC 7319 TaxID=118161 RepID=UPI00034AF41C|nr:SGNH/GDSL hydrolase family protein [Pleurocapsa sp. PCC 7319]
MFKSRTRERRIFTNRQRIRRRSSGLWVLVSIALILLVSELLVRIFIDLSGNKREFSQAQTGSEITDAYNLKFVTDKSSSNQDPKNQSQLKAQPSLAVGYRLLGNQEHKYWQINEQGFRDRDPVPATKPKNEIRIFLLGGSTAFGYGSSSNEATISEQLETRFQQRLQQQKSSPQLYKPDLLSFEPQKKQKQLAKPSKIKPGNYRVINAAVPGYTSGNELAQVALQLLKFKPDLMVVLDGYGDLMLPSTEEATQVPLIKQYLDNQQTDFASYVSQILKPLEQKSYLVKILQDGWLNADKSDKKANFFLNEQTSNLVLHLPPNETELQKRVDRYISHQKQILNLSAAAQIPLVVAIQPEITGRNPSQLTETEGEIATQLGRTYIQQVKASYPAFTQANRQLAQAFPQNIKAVDLYQLTEQYPSPTFIDPIHLQDAANQKVAEQLYYAIASFPKMQVVPAQAAPPKPINPTQYLN